MKPCPFCNSLSLTAFPHPGGWQVECNGCGARGPVTSMKLNSRTYSDSHAPAASDAFRVWNERAEPESEIDALLRGAKVE